MSLRLIDWNLWVIVNFAKKTSYWQTTVEKNEHYTY